MGTQTRTEFTRLMNKLTADEVYAVTIYTDKVCGINDSPTSNSMYKPIMRLHPEAFIYAKIGEWLALLAKNQHRIYLLNENNTWVCVKEGRIVEQSRDYELLYCVSKMLCYIYGTEPLIKINYVTTY